MDAVPAARLDNLVALLRSRGCRITPQRLAILRLLVHSRSHPSAEQMHVRLLRRFPT
jgi:Fur family peroxide stress response transcriptional regulator